MIDSHRVCVLHGSASSDLARSVAEYLNIPVCKSLVSHFSDGETRVELLENMRGRDVYIIQSTCHPVNDNLMELVFMIDACRRASAGSISVVIPYFGYARQDRRVRSSRVPISAKVVAEMLEMVGMDRLVTVDLHADQIQGFFRVPVDNVYASLTLFDQDDLSSRVKDPLFVSPDVGGVVRARAIAKRFNQSDLAIIDKRRPKPNAVEIMNVIGDVKDRNCVIVDDIVDTAGTLCQAAHILKDQGAKSVYAYCVHPVLSGKALENIQNSALNELVVSDTIVLSEEAKKLPKIRQLSLAGVISQTLSRMNQKASVSSLFEDGK
jgi:ribose-phosphate pyrophosphokinase